ncbi:MAG: glycosyltransferase family 9 protein [Ignavibacteriales bacterium]|nr:glycosyltransferase family 9 protein [Ignavibacteriales bacterium]
MISKILVIHTSFIGDAILVLPFLQELQKQYPSASIDILTSPRAHDIFRASPHVQKIQILDKRRKHKGVFATYKFAKELREDAYDIVYSLHRSFRTSLLVWASGIKPAYGFDSSTASFVYTNKTVYHKDMHEVQRLLCFLDKKYENDSWKILPDMNSRQYAGVVEKFLTDHNLTAGFIGIAPGSVWATKRYPVEHYINVIKALEADGYKIVLLGGPDEKLLCNEISNRTKALNACGVLPLVAVRELLLHCLLMLTNDSALTHLSLAANCTILTIYCSTVPGFGFYPYSKKSAFIGIETLPCKPCGIHGHNSCPEKHFKCGNDLIPEKITEKIHLMLKGII